MSSHYTTFLSKNRELGTSHKDLAKKQLQTPTLFKRSCQRQTFKSVNDKKQGILHKISQHVAMRHALCIWPDHFFLRNQKT